MREGAGPHREPAPGAHRPAAASVRRRSLSPRIAHGFPTGRASSATVQIFFIFILCMHSFSALSCPF